MRFSPKPSRYKQKRVPSFSANEKLFNIVIGAFCISFSMLAWDFMLRAAGLELTDSARADTALIGGLLTGFFVSNRLSIFYAKKRGKPFILKSEVRDATSELSTVGSIFLVGSVAGFALLLVTLTGNFLLNGLDTSNVAHAFKFCMIWGYAFAIIRSFYR